MTTTSTLGVGDLITALPIPKHVTAVRGIYSDGRRSRIVWERRHDGWRFSSERRSAVALLGTFVGGLVVHAVAAPAEPEDVRVATPGTHLAHQIVRRVHDELKDRGRGGLIAFSWDGETLGLAFARHPHHHAPGGGVGIYTKDDPRLTPDGVLVWTGTARMDGIDTTVPVRVTWTPERTGAVQ